MEKTDRHGPRPVAPRGTRRAEPSRPVTDRPVKDSGVQVRCPRERRGAADKLPGALQRQRGVLPGRKNGGCGRRRTDVKEARMAGGREHGRQREIHAGLGHGELPVLEHLATIVVTFGAAGMLRGVGVVGATKERVKSQPLQPAMHCRGQPDGDQQERSNLEQAWHAPTVCGADPLSRRRGLAKCAGVPDGMATAGRGAVET